MTLLAAPPNHPRPAGDGQAGRVLVADDQPDVLAALQPGRAERFDVLVMDLNYARDTTSGREGLELVARVRAVDPGLPIVVMTAWSTVPLAVAIMRNGVSDFVEKPWDNVRLLSTLRAQVASGRHLRRVQRLESDARDVQRRLLSRAVPDVSGYGVGVAWRFAEQLGGDAYELAALPGGRLGVVIADVCGKGTPAALLMASAQATLRDLLALPLAPHEVCGRLDQALSPRLAPDRFVSLAYAVLDAPHGSLSYANAGHPPPFLLRADGSVRRLDRGGPVLGLLPDARYETAAAALLPGDRLVLYTDGVVEAASASGDGSELGEERLLSGLREMRDLTAPDAARAVLEMAVQFSGGDPLGDDATIVIVDVAGS